MENNEIMTIENDEMEIEETYYEDSCDESMDKKNLVIGGLGVGLAVALGAYAFKRLKPKAKAAKDKFSSWNENRKTKKESKKNNEYIEVDQFEVIDSEDE